MGAGAPSSGKSTRIDLVPILDALVVVIFFLVLSISFTELTKLTLPPTQMADGPPLDTQKTSPSFKPKLLASFKKGQIDLVLTWEDKKSQFLEDSLSRVAGHSAQLEKTVALLVEKFKKKYPSEKTLQVSATKEATFQEFVTLIDGAKLQFEDIVMSSYKEAERHFEQKL